MSEELPAVGFLENLEDEVRAQLVSQGTLYTLTSGQHIIEEGAEQDHLFNSREVLRQSVLMAISFLVFTGVWFLALLSTSDVKQAKTKKVLDYRKRSIE